MQKWADNNEMQINKKKSGILFHQAAGRPFKPGDGFVEGYPVEIKYKYLVIWIDRTLNFYHHLKHIKQKIVKGMKIIYMLKKKGVKE